MRGVETRIQEIRHRIFTEVARMAYHTEWSVAKRIEELPYKIIPGEVGNFRNDVFLERAIVGERLRLAMGLPNRGAGEHAPISDNIEAADRDVIRIQRQGLGDAIAEIDDCLQTTAFAAVGCAHAEIQRCCQHKDHQCKDQVLPPRLPFSGTGSCFSRFAVAHAA